MNPGNTVYKSGLAGSVRSDDPEYLLPMDIKADINKSLSPPKVLEIPFTDRMGSALIPSPISQTGDISLEINHDSLALKDNKACKGSTIDDDSEGPKALNTSDKGTSIKLPTTAPTSVPPPPMTTEAIGMIEKSRAKRERPAHI